MSSHRWKTVNDFSKDILQEKPWIFRTPKTEGQQKTRRRIPEDFNLRQHYFENIRRFWIAHSLK